MRAASQESNMLTTALQHKQRAIQSNTKQYKAIQSKQASKQAGSLTAHKTARRDHHTLHQGPAGWYWRSSPFTSDSRCCTSGVRGSCCSCCISACSSVWGWGGRLREVEGMSGCSVRKRWAIPNRADCRQDADNHPHICDAPAMPQRKSMHHPSSPHPSPNPPRPPPSSPNLTLRSSIICTNDLGFSTAAGAAAAGMRMPSDAPTSQLPSHTMLTSPAAATPDASSVDQIRLLVVKNMEGSARSSSSGVSCSADLILGGSLEAAAAAAGEGVAAGGVVAADPVVREQGLRGRWWDRGVSGWRLPQRAASREPLATRGETGDAPAPPPLANGARCPAAATPRAAKLLPSRRSILFDVCFEMRQVGGEWSKGRRCEGRVWGGFAR